MFADIVAGASVGGLDIVFDGSSLGAFSQTITISSFGSNASGYRGPTFDTSLMMRGSVAVAAIPEPETYLLMSTGLLAPGSRGAADAARTTRAESRLLGGVDRVCR
jgi:hypothetical protein